MKLLVISAAFPPMRAGEADYVFHFCRLLAEREVDIELLTTKGESLPCNLPYKIAPKMRSWSWRDLPRLVGFIKRCSPDAVLLVYSDWTYKRHPMVTFAPLIAKWLIPAASFVTLFPIGIASIGASVLTRGFMKALSKCAKRHVDYVLGTLLRLSDRIIVLSEGNGRWFCERNPEVKGKLIISPPPPLMYVTAEDGGSARSEGRKALGVSENEFLLAYLGYVYSSKGVNTLFEALCSVSRCNPEVRLVMIGGDLITTNNSYSYTREIKRLLDRLGLNDRVIWTGPYDWDSEQASIYLRAADACVFPFTDGVTLNRSSVAAAAAHGLPIVTTRGPALEQPFLDRVNMLLCPPNDPQAIAAAIESLVKNDDLRAQLRAGALKLAGEWFSWNRAVQQIMEALSLKPAKLNPNSGQAGRKGETAESMV